MVCSTMSVQDRKQPWRARRKETFKVVFFATLDVDLTSHFKFSDTVFVSSRLDWLNSVGPWKGRNGSLHSSVVWGRIEEDGECVRVWGMVGHLIQQCR